MEFQDSAADVKTQAGVGILCCNGTACFIFTDFFCFLFFFLGKVANVKSSNSPSERIRASP